MKMTVPENKINIKPFAHHSLLIYVVEYYEVGVIRNPGGFLVSMILLE